MPAVGKDGPVVVVRVHLGDARWNQGGEMIADVLKVGGYTHHSGHHCESTAARNVFAHAGIDLSEEMLQKMRAHAGP